MTVDTFSDENLAIPDDVMDAANYEAAYYRAWLNAGNSTGYLSDHATDGLSDSIARAILAERQSSRATIDGLRGERDALEINIHAVVRRSDRWQERAEAAEASLTTARADGIEEAAKVVEAALRLPQNAASSESVRGHNLANRRAVAAIRALSPPANEPAKDETEVTG